MKNIIIISLSVLMVCSCEPNNRSVSYDGISLEVMNLQDTLVAGEPSPKIELKTNLPTKEITKIQMIISNALHSVSVSPHLKSNQYWVEIPIELLRKSGDVDYYFHHDGQLLKQGKFHIKPNLNKTEIKIMAKPIHLLHGSSDQSNISIFPMDIYNNPLPDGTSFVFNQYIDKQHIKNQMILDNMVHFQILQLPESEDIMYISATYKNHNSTMYSLFGMPDRAVNFDVSIAEKHPLADQYHLSRWEINALKDKRGTTVADNTEIQFISQMGGLYNIGTGASVNGRAEFAFPNPGFETTLLQKSLIRLTPNVDNKSLSFIAAIQDFPLEIKNNVLMVGPVHSHQNYVISDGIPLDIFYIDAKQNTRFLSTEYLEDGKFIKPLNLLNPMAEKPYQLKIKCLGIEKIIKIE